MLLVEVEWCGYMWVVEKSTILVHFQLHKCFLRRAIECFNQSVTHSDTPHLTLRHDSSHCHPFNFFRSGDASKELSKSAKIAISHSKPIFYISSNWSNRHKPILCSWALMVAQLNPIIVSGRMYVCGSYRGIKTLGGQDFCPRVIPFHSLNLSPDTALIPSSR